jgi:DNA-binding cell septation regulator SpoVG
MKGEIMKNNRTCNIKLVDFGSLKALVSVQIHGMEIRGFKVIDQGDDKPWVAPPSREILRDGRKEYFNIVRFAEPEDKREFNDWILSEYRKGRSG